MAKSLSDILAIARAAAFEAGRCIVEYRAKGKINYTLKGERNLVTAADLAAEKIILAAITNSFPTHKILSEETNSILPEEDLNGPALWIVDPIDGTTNYAHGHFNVGISIAYAEHGKVMAALVHAPFLNETFEAVFKAGAKLNGSPIAASQCSEMREAVIATGFPYERNHTDLLLQRVGTVLSNCRDLRRLGAATLDICWVACGRLDGFYESLMPWDVAAAGLIAREAGAVWDHLPHQTQTTPKENLPSDINSHEVLVCAPGIYKELKRVLTNA